MEKSPLIFGLILQSSMILALGAQNLFIIEKGLLRDRPVLVATICSICDVSLIFLGVLGVGSVFAQNPTMSLLLKIAGAAFLFKYAYEKFREARSGQEMQAQLSLQKKGLLSIVFSTLAVSLLNPHVYLDTFVLIGGYSTKYMMTEDKIHFAMGAGLFSIIWFFSLSLGSSFFSSTLKKPSTMKVVNYVATIIMTYLGAGLLYSI